MFPWLGPLLRFLGPLLGMVSKLIPSREEKAGRAMAERDQLQASAEARQRMDNVKEPTSDEVTDALDRGEF